MAHGTGALGANCQPGYNMVYPFLYDTCNLVFEKLRFIIVQVKDDVVHKNPDPKLFRKMDPFLCGLLKLETDNCQDFTMPIICIVFALGGERPALTHMTYQSPVPGVASLEDAGYPKFMAYDFWCSGISLGLLQLVHKCNETMQAKWKVLLGKTDKFHGIYSQSKFPNLQWSQYPGGGGSVGHFIHA
ncbi:hypothetical protein EI94DRAFT_1698240 [Lactarius quietus]|nr:hypothetical protein EI94DRAFT_1698240 [Lactarius quietus]